MNVRLIILLATSAFHQNHASTDLCQEPNCAEASFKPLGCFKDKRSSRTLPYYIYNERDPSIANYGGQQIDWDNWAEYLPGFICRCATKAKELGYDLIGVQFYGECHAGHNGVDHYDAFGTARCKDCVGTDMNDCNERKFCAGKGFRNMVYNIVDVCSVGMERIGCFNDRTEQPRLLPSLLLSDRDESLQEPIFSGQLIDWENWYEHLPNFVCRCAQKAQENGWKVFGVQFWGECWSGPDDSVFFLEGHASPGQCADQCFNDCSCSTKFCTGKNFTNAVYALTSSSDQGGSGLDINPPDIY